MQELQQEWDRFQNLQFPRHPDDEKLGDLFAELVDVDGFYAGLISSFLKGAKTKKKFMFINEEFNNRLDLAKPSNTDPAFKDWIALKSRKDEIDKMVKMMLKLYHEKK